MRTRTRTVTAVILAGMLAGAVGAFALPRDDPGASAPARLDVRRIAPLMRLDARQFGALDVVPGSRRVALRAADPAGGPEWAVETSRGSYRIPAGVPRRTVGREVFGERTCLRLGRIVDGRFGWLDGTGSFRPAGPDTASTPTSCRSADDRGSGTFQSTTWISHPTFGPPVPLARIVWGGAPGAAAVEVRADGSDSDVTTGGDAFLAFAPAAGTGPAPDVRVIALDGRRTPLRDQERVGRRVPGLRVALPPGHLAAQAPDPEGGAPFGVAAGRLPNGRWCHGNAGRIVDRAVGDIDPRLDIFFDQTSFVYQCGPSRKIKARYRSLTRTRPLAYSFTTGAPAGAVGAAPSAARTALRTLPATTVFAGLARADVRTIRVRAPTQTRVLRPSGPAHAFVVALNGTFPSGRIVFEVTFTDGTVARQGEGLGDL